MENYIRYKGKGEHSVNELEKIIEQREKELHLLRSGQVVLPQANVSGSLPSELYNWSDVHLDGDITRRDCDKIIEWMKARQ